MQKRKDSSHDFGKRHSAAADRARSICTPTIFRPTSFREIRSAAPQYWRDVGTLDAYYEASMDLRSVSPALNLYNRQWPLRTAGYFDAPAKFVFDEDGGAAWRSIRSSPAARFISGGSVERSVLGAASAYTPGAEVEDSVIFDNCDIGRHAKVRRAILDKNVKIPEGSEIGYDLEKDRKKYHVTESGIVVIEGHQSTVDIATLQV